MDGLIALGVVAIVFPALAYRARKRKLARVAMLREIGAHYQDSVVHPGGLFRGDTQLSINHREASVTVRLRPDGDHSRTIWQALLGEPTASFRVAHEAAYRLVDDADEIVAGIELVCRFAASDLFGLDAVAALDGAAIRDGALPCAIISGPGDVRIGPVDTDDGTVTRASCEAGSESRVPDPDAVAATGARFSADAGQVILTWPGIEKSPKRLAAGVDLLRLLSRGPSDGAFR